MGYTRREIISFYNLSFKAIRFLQGKKHGELFIFKEKNMKKHNTIISNEYEFGTRNSIKTVSFDENGMLMPVITHITNSDVPYSVQREGKYIITVLYKQLQKAQIRYYIDNKESTLFLSSPIWQNIKTNNPWILEWLTDRYNVFIPVDKNETLAVKAKESKGNKIEKIKEIFSDFNPEPYANIHSVKEYIKEVDSRPMPSYHYVDYVKELNGYILKRIIFKPLDSIKSVTYVFGKIKE